MMISRVLSARLPQVWQVPQQLHHQPSQPWNLVMRREIYGWAACVDVWMVWHCGDFRANSNQVKRPNGEADNSCYAFFFSYYEAARSIWPVVICNNHDDLSSWRAAKENCSSQGGFLASIHSQVTFSSKNIPFSFVNSIKTERILHFQEENDWLAAEVLKSCCRFMMMIGMF